MFNVMNLFLVALVSLMVINCSNAQENMRELSMTSYWRAEAMASSGNHMYIAAGEDGLRIHNVENVNSPFEIAHLKVTGTARDIAIYDETVFIVAGWGGLSQIDITDPTEPREINFFDDHPGEACAIVIDGDFAYVGYDSDGMLIFDISNPENELQPIAIFNPGWEVDYLVMANGFLCAADSVEGLFVLDIEDRENPGVLGNLNLWESDILDIAAQGENIALACRHEGLRTISIENPERPSEIGSLVEDLIVGGVVLVGDVALVANNYHSDTQIISLENWADPQVIGMFDISSLRADNSLGDDQIALGLHSGGYQIFDLTNPNEVENIGLHTIGDDIIDVTVQGEIAYVLSDNLTCVDISDPEVPILLGSVRLEGSPAKIEVNEDIAYIPSQSYGMQIYDVSDPRNPTAVALYKPRYFDPRVVKIQGEVAYAVAFHIIWALDISDPSRVEPLGNLRYFGNLYPTSITVAGDHAFVSSSRGGLRIQDIRDPRKMTEVGYILLSDGISASAVNGNFAYVSSWDGQFYVIDISNVELPQLIGQTQSANGSDIVYSDGMVYLASDWAGVRAIDVSNPEDPIEVGYYEGISGAAKGIAVSEDIVLLAGRDFFSIYTFTGEDGENVGGNGNDIPTLFAMQSYPNPFNSTTTISYRLPQEGRVTLQVYNPFGQRISTLYDGYRTAGTHSTNMTADNLPSGLYFVRLESAGQLFTQKVMLIK